MIIRSIFLKLTVSPKRTYSEVESIHLLKVQSCQEASKNMRLLYQHSKIYRLQNRLLELQQKTTKH